MTNVTNAELITEIAQLARGLDEDVEAYAFFDADHTLWCADLADVVVRDALEQRLFQREASAPLAALLAASGGVPEGEPHADYRALYARYTAGEVAEETIIRAMVLCFAAWRVDELVDYTRRLVARDLDGLRYEGIDEIFAALRSAGFEIRVISGTAQWLVEAGVERLGVSKEHVFGARAEVAGGKIGTVMAEPLTYRAGKGVAMKTFVDGGRVALAFGDSMSDESMFARAVLRIAVNPRPSLRRHLAANEPEQWRVWLPARTVNGKPVATLETDLIVV